MIKEITAQNFRRYGRVIEYPNRQQKGKTKNFFHIVLTEPKKTGWRIAYLIVRDKTIRKLEQHPYSWESFEPILGRSLLYVAKHKKLVEIECFDLNRPVILNKGIWHGVVTVNTESEIKLTENAKVKCIYWPLGFRLSNK